MSESKKKDSPSREAILTFVNDLKFAIRSLGRSKGLVITVVLTLALGIGANAAIFTLVRGVLLRPLVNRDEDRLIYIQQSAPGISPGGVPFSVPEIQDLRASVKTLGSFGKFSVVGFTMIGLGEPREVRAGVVNGSYFDVVGLHPVLGRLIGPEDDGPKAAGVAVLTYPFWSSTLKSDPSVIGKALRLGSGFGDRSATIIGRSIAEAAAEAKGFTDDGRIALESARPERISQDGNTSRFRTVVFRADEATEDGMEAHHVEIG